MKRKWRTGRIIVLSLLLAFTIPFTACTDSAPKDAASGDEMIKIELPSNAMSENIWQYTASVTGIVSEGTYDEYNALNAGGETNEDGTVTLPDEIAPGTSAYFFKGEKAGEVELNFTYANPDNADEEPEFSATYKIKVYADKTLEVISSSNDFGS